MVGLIDIAPLTETVEVRGQSIEVCGVSARGVALLLGRYPELRMMMTGKQVSPERFMEMGGEVVAAIIAAGCGYPGNKQAEETADKLDVEAQMDLLQAIFRLTLPNGLAPFVAKLTAMGGILAGEASPTVPDTTSRRASKG